MKVLLSFVPAAFAAISVTQPKLFDAEHMKETFKAIAAQRQLQGGDKIDDATSENIRHILDLIEGNLTNALAADYQIEVGLFNDAIAELEQCNTDVRGCKSMDVSVKCAVYEFSRDDHSHCRQFEYDTCNWAHDNCTKQDDKVRGYGGRWTTWNNYAAHNGAECSEQTSDDVSLPTQWFEQALAFAQAEGAGCLDGETAGECFARTTHATVNHETLGLGGCTAAERSATCIDGSNGTYCECCDYASCRANCATADDLDKAQYGKCEELQKHVEDAHCGFKVQGCQCCDDFATCWYNEFADLTAELVRVRGVVDLINAQQHALECLLCYGNNILASDAGEPNFAACEGAPCEGCRPYPTGSVTGEYPDTDTCNADMHAMHPVEDLSFSPNVRDGSHCKTSVGAMYACDTCDSFTPQPCGAWSSE